MSSDNSTHLWELMSKYTFHVDDKDYLKEDFTCVICKKLIIDAFHSFCGCKYCFKCITEYLSHEQKHCPGNNAECHDEYLIMERNVTRNVRMNKQIIKLKVKCPNKSCEYKAELFHMEEHIRVCQKQAVKCPYVTLGCEEEEAFKDFIISHLNEDVLRHSDILIKYILNLKNEFDNLKMDFDINKNEIISLKEESYKKDVRMKEQDDEIKLLKNESNGIKFKIEDLQKEIVSLKEESEKNMKQELNCKSKILERNELDIQNLKRESENNKTEIFKLNNEIVSLKEESEKVEKMMQKFDCFKESSKTELEKNKLKVEMLKKELLKAEFKKDVEHIEKQNNKIILSKEDKFVEEKCEKTKNLEEWINYLNIKVDFIWKIDRIFEKKGQEIFSKPFYSNNYKLRLHYDYYNNYNLGFCIMRGDNDDRVEWPLKLTVTLSLMNQVSLQTQHSETFKYDNKCNKKAFEKPKYEENSLMWRNITKNDHSMSIFEDSLIIVCVLSS